MKDWFTCGTWTACVVEDGEVKLGGNGLAMVALAQHAAATGNRQHLELIDELGRWILLTQAEDGEFRIHKQSHPDGRVSSFVPAATRSWRSAMNALVMAGLVKQS